MKHLGNHPMPARSREICAASLVIRREIRDVRRRTLARNFGASFVIALKHHHHFILWCSVSLPFSCCNRISLPQSEQSQATLFRSFIVAKSTVQSGLTVKAYQGMPERSWHLTCLIARAPRTSLALRFNVHQKGRSRTTCSTHCSSRLQETMRRLQRSR